MGKLSEFGELIGISGSTLRPWEREGKLIPERTLYIAHKDRLCFSSRLYGLRKYKEKVKLIVEGVDPCSESVILS